MVTIHNLDQIKTVLDSIDLAQIISEGFIEYSQGNAVVPPVGELIFNDPPGDTHIKYGYLKNKETYVVKIASGFYENRLLGLPSGSGLMLVFSQKTGALQSILLDDGYLTNIRTAVAGQICSRYLAPDNVTSIGIFGTGVQARMQAIYSAKETAVSTLHVWGRNASALEKYVQDMRSLGFSVTAHESPAAVASASRLLITTTPSEAPLLQLPDIRPDTHITAVGSDTPDKQELSSAILAKANIVVADSIIQCETRGEIAKALADQVLDKRKIVELGDLILHPEKAKNNRSGISVADLTGVAVQDIQIATAVCNALTTNK